VDNRDEVKAFLSSRRAKISPERAGLASYSRNRRVPGLRRSEVADLAGVSVEYYSQLERGNLAGVSESVLDALARALHLDDAEREHLLDLARAAGPARRAGPRPAVRHLRPNLARILAGMIEVPGLVQNGRLDVLAANPLAQALFAPVFADPARPANFARFTFLDPHARTFWANWERVADDTVAMLRTEAGRDPYDKHLTDLVGELSTRSDAFRVRWAAHNVRLHRTGHKHIQHPVAGELHLSYEVMEVPADPGLALVAFTAEAANPTDDALRLLASWAATHHPADALTTPNQT
jgi:transcriptional regulator with XRE-family HTH domain